MHRILGQDRALDVLRSALRSQRMHHAWLFSGPAGVGKHTTAIELARILLDPDAQPTLTGEIEASPDSPTSRAPMSGSPRR
jgi:DNA polymerase III subunit delta'